MRNAEKFKPMTNVVSLADARAARNATKSPQLDHAAAAALRPWSFSKKGNLWFRARDHVFVALSPKWRGSSWRLWVKSSDGSTRTLPGDFASFDALQRGVVAFLAEMPPGVPASL
jgi:hypothetical protein